jgi:hypothetical protein
MEEIDVLWEQWKLWSERSGSGAGTKAWFGRNLRSAVPGLSDGEATIRGERRRVYRGIGLNLKVDESHAKSVSALSSEPLKDDEIPF